MTILATSFAAYAVIKYTATITNTAQIMGYELQLWRTDGTPQQVTAIPWGGIEPGTSKDTETVLVITEQLKIKNTGDYGIYMAWQLNSTLLTGVTLTCMYKDGTVWYALPEHVYKDTTAWCQLAVPVGGYSKAIKWTLAIAVGTARSVLTFNINLLAADTATS